MNGTLETTRLCAADDVGEGEVRRVDTTDGRSFAVYRLGGRFFVSDDTCPHARTSLSKGWVEDGRIVCPVHFAEFELGTGEVSNPPIGCGKLRFYPVDRIGDALFATLG